MLGIDSVGRLDDEINKLYEKTDARLYGILFRVKGSNDDSDVLIGDHTIYNVKSGSKFHILVPGWDFDAEKLSSTPLPENSTHFSISAFTSIEEEVKRRMEGGWRGTTGDHHLIILSKGELGTDWKHAVVVNLDKLVRDKIFATIPE